MTMRLKSSENTMKKRGSLMNENEVMEKLCDDILCIELLPILDKVRQVVRKQNRNAYK